MGLIGLSMFEVFAASMESRDDTLRDQDGRNGDIAGPETLSDDFDVRNNSFSLPSM